MDRTRSNRFVIMLSEVEREAVERLAKVERLPASTYARRRLLQEVDQRGLWPVRNEAVERLTA